MIFPVLLALAIGADLASERGKRHRAIRLGLARKSVLSHRRFTLDVLRRAGGMMYKFKDLPLPAKKAIVRYFGEESDNETWWDLDTALRHHGEDPWAYAEIPMADMKTTAWRWWVDSGAADREGWSTFDDWHRLYLRREGTRVPRHPITERWPVILSGMNHEDFIWDGHHRFASYVRDDHPTVPAVLPLRERERTFARTPPISKVRGQDGAAQ
jgi:hypothetical protein